MQAVQAVGSIVQGIGAYQAGRYNKAMAFRQAREEEAAGEAEAGILRDRARAAIGQQVNAQFSNGMMGGTGSALDALAESQINAALDVMMARREAAGQAASYRAQGRQAKRAGTFALISGVLQAGGQAAAQHEDWAAARRGTRAPASANTTTPYGDGSNMTGDIWNLDY